MYPRAQIGIAASTSSIECCFKKTVDKDMMTAAAKNAALHFGVEKSSLCQAQNSTAKEPMTCSEGQTLVLVSNL